MTIAASESSKEITGKFIVRLGADERVRLEQLLNKGNSPAKLLLKARILLKADVSEAGEGWSDSRIIEALDTNISMVSRVRRKLAQEGLEAVLCRKQRPACAIQPVAGSEEPASVKKYIVRLSEEERNHLEVLIGKGKSPAKLLLKARILLKADVSEAGEGWSDGQIVKAFDTNVSMVERVRRQLVEEGFEPVLRRKQRAMPAIQPIFDGEKEARLITLACSAAPEGRKCWTLRLLEDSALK